MLGQLTNILWFPRLVQFDAFHSTITQGWYTVWLTCHRMLMCFDDSIFQPSSRVFATPGQRPLSSPQVRPWCRLGLRLLTLLLAFYNHTARTTRIILLLPQPCLTAHSQYPMTSLLWFKDGMHIYLSFLGKDILVLLGHMNPVWSFCASPYKSHVASAPESDYSVCIWDQRWIRWEKCVIELGCSTHTIWKCTVRAEG